MSVMADGGMGCMWDEPACQSEQMLTPHPLRDG